MPFVAIVGAGDLGGTLAHALARRDRIAEICLIDAAPGTAAGIALDVQQAGPIERFRARVRASEDLSVARGAAVIVLADSARPPHREWQGEDGLTLIRALVRLDRHAVIICAGATQRTLIVQGLDATAVSPACLLGSAPGALVSALRAIIALETDSSPNDVTLSVHGIPPERSVVAWSSATIGGYAISDLLDPPSLARVKARVSQLWPPGPYALAAAAAAACEAVAGGRTRPTFTCFAAMNGPSQNARVAAMTVRLGSRGVRELIEPALSPIERVQLDNALG